MPIHLRLIAMFNVPSQLGLLLLMLPIRSDGMVSGFIFLYRYTAVPMVFGAVIHPVSGVKAFKAFPAYSFAYLLSELKIGTSCFVMHCYYPRQWRHIDAVL